MPLEDVTAVGILVLMAWAQLTLFELGDRGEEVPADKAARLARARRALEETEARTRRIPPVQRPADEPEDTATG